MTKAEAMSYAKEAARYCKGEQSAQTGRSEEIEAGEPAGPGVDRANGVAQESAPGEIDRQGNPYRLRR